MRTVLTPSSVELWLAEMAIAGLRARFPNPDYRFAVEDTSHVDNPTCLAHLRRVKVVCHTNFTPSTTLVAAWKGQAPLR